MRAVLVLNERKAVYLRTAAGRAVVVETFPVPATSSLAFQTWLDQRRSEIITLCIDSTRDEYHQQTLPQLQYGERGKIHRSMLERAFPAAKMASVFEYRSSWLKRKSRRLLLVGLSDEQAIGSWLDQIDQSRILVDKLHYLPLLVARYCSRLSAGKHCALVVCATVDERIRLTLCANTRLLLSRQLDKEASLITEIQLTLQYACKNKLINDQSSNLDIVLLDRDPLILQWLPGNAESVDARLQDQLTHYCQSPPAISAWLDLVIDVPVKPAYQIGNDGLRRYMARQLSQRLSILAMSMLALALGATLATTQIEVHYQHLERELGRHQQRLSERMAGLNNPIDSAYPPAAEMKATLELVNRLSLQGVARPIAPLSLLAQAFSDQPGVELSVVRWRKTNAGQLLVAGHMDDTIEHMADAVARFNDLKATVERQLSADVNVLRAPFGMGEGRAGHRTIDADIDDREFRIEIALPADNALPSS